MMATLPPPPLILVPEWHSLQVESPGAPVSAGSAPVTFASATIGARVRIVNADVAISLFLVVILLNRSLLGYCPVIVMSVVTPPDWIRNTLVPASGPRTTSTLYIPGT